MFEFAFGKRLRSLRKVSGFTQEQLSAKLGITPEHLSNMERGKATPSFKLIEKISQTLNTEPANLFLFPPPQPGEDHPKEQEADGYLPPDYSLYITDVGFWEYDATTDTYDWSDPVYQMFGVARQSFTPHWEGFLKIIPPEDMAVVASNWSELLEGNAVPPFSFRVRHPDDSFRFLIAKVEQIYDENGDIALFKGVTIDYTEQKNLEDALRRLQQTLEEQVQVRTSELHSMIAVLGEEIADRNRAEKEAKQLSHRLAMAMEIAEIGIWEYSRATGVLHLEEPLVRSLGYGSNETEMPLAEWEKRIHPEDRAAHDAARKAHFSGETDLYEATFRLAMANGDWQWLHCIGRATEHDVHGAPVIITGTFQNITALKQTEMARHTSEERFRDLVENIREIFWIVEPNRTVSYVSPHFERIYQMRADELAKDSRSFMNRVHPEDRSLVEEAMVRVWTRGEESNVTYRIVLPDGGIRWLNVRGFPVLDKDGSIIRAVGVGDDVTEMEIMNRRLKQAKEDAESASRAKSSFIASMSHEIRTPLTGMLALLQLLAHTELNEEQQEYVSLAKSSGSSLLGIINDVLDISRIEAGRMDLTITRFSLREVTDSVAHLFKPLARQSGVELRTLYDRSMPDALYGDPGRIKQILFNLVGNAVKFTKVGQVTVSVSQDGRGEDGRLTVVFEVSDTGPGIPQNKLSEIFDNFTQLSSAGEHGPGSGLGLAIVQRLAEIMDGGVGVESAVGQGSTFRVRLPLAAVEEKPASPPSATSRNDGGRSLKALVAEDDRVNQTALSRMLQILGHETLCASNGTEALEMLQEEDIDLLLLDIRMPDVNGYQVTRCVRDGALDNVQRDLPIIAVTAFAMQEDRERILAAGVDGFLTKPFTIEELQAVLCAVME